MNDRTAVPLRILHLEDSRRDAEIIREHLVDAGFALQLFWAPNAEEFTSLLHRGDYDLILADYQVPGFDALAAVTLARSIHPGIPIIFVSGAIGEERAVELLKQGATDYVLKGRLAKLPVAIERALDEVREHKAREQAEEALRRLNRDLRAISKCNETMMRAASEHALLGEICRIVCDEAGYQMAWVGYAEHDEARTIRPVAWAGVEDGCLQRVALTWADTERGRGLVGTAIRSGDSAWIQDFAADGQATSWRDTALHEGFRSGIALPLKDESGSTFGVLNICATEPNSFTPDEVRMLEELSRDLAFGIAVLRARIERKQAETALAESEAKLRSILDHIGIGVCLIGPGMEILDVNAQMRNWHPAIDTTRKSICCQPVNELPHERECDSCPTVRTLQDGLVHEAVTRRMGADSMRDYRVVSSPVVNASGAVTAAIEMVEDITDKLLLESQFQQAQKMEAIGRLAGGVAHDFNNALNVILGHAELALLRTPQSSAILDNLQEVRKAAIRSSNLTRQLLAFARKQKVARRALDLNETVESMLKMLRHLIGEDIDLAWKPGAGLWSINIDPSQVDQVLANLCVNARDAIASTGKVIIETDNVAFDEAPCAEHAGVASGDYVVLGVTDNGCGMDKETQSRLFEPFFTTKPVGKGTGLGLATVYGIVKQNDGFIRVSSEVGRGTTFKVHLPRHMGEARQKLPEDLSPRFARGWETVLLVEDDLANLTMARKILEQLGYRVLVASTPAEAIRTVEEWAGQVHLLLTDVVMPGMSGPELAKLLVSRTPGLRCLFMSGYAGDTVSSRGLLDGSLSFIRKPFSMLALADKLREVLRRD